jgi:hypothetical protein
MQIHHHWVRQAGFFFVALALTFSGCAFESSPGNPDAGDNDADGGNGDGPREYPPGPYGAGFEETMANIQLSECLCDQDPPQAQPISLDSFLDAKVTLISVHAGWCTYCKVEARTMESNLYQRYKENGLKILLVLFQDAVGGEVPERLLEYCCAYKKYYNMTFTLAIDPGAAVMGAYFRPTEAGTPLNMLLDRMMEIRYKVEGLLTDTSILEGHIEGIIEEGL